MGIAIKQYRKTVSTSCQLKKKRSWHKVRIQCYHTIFCHCHQAPNTVFNLSPGTWNTVSSYNEAKPEAYSWHSITDINVTGHKCCLTVETLHGHKDYQKQPFCLKWGPLPRPVHGLAQPQTGFLTAMKIPLLRKRSFYLGPTACAGAVSPASARGRSHAYNLPRPALLSVSALTAEKQQPPSPWQPVTSAPLSPPACPAGSP